jgi:hypothetical protein
MNFVWITSAILHPGVGLCDKKLIFILLCNWHSYTSTLSIMCKHWSGLVHLSALRGVNPRRQEKICEDDGDKHNICTLLVILIWGPSNAESKPVVKIIYIYTHCNLWCHRQFITIFYQFLHIRIEIIHGSHMYILFLPRVGLYVSFLPLANARVKTSWH